MLPCMPTPDLTRAPVILKRLPLHGYAVFTGPLNVNLIGVRSNTATANAFDDTFYVVFQDTTGRWVEHRYPCTTDPGLYWLHHPMNVDGTAILVPGQYRGAWVLGQHSGYEALVQDRPVNVWRDRNKDGVLNRQGAVDNGVFGINIHRASASKPSPTVDKWSAGCQVLQSPTDYATYMDVVRASAKRYGPRFTYTLLDA